jgi:Fur family ferric uptake transcriptional regulator
VSEPGVIRRGDSFASAGETHWNGSAPSSPQNVTAASPSLPLPAHTLDAAVAALRARGLRVSAARRLVLEALYAADGPVSADAIAGGLDGRLPVSDLASVYRNLETLEGMGLVRHVHLGHGPGLYAPAGLSPREFLSCEHCGAHLSVPPGALDEVRDTLRAAFGWEARFTHFPVVGACPGCREH